MKEETERKHRIIAWISTGVIVTLLLLLFFYITIDYEIPQLPEAAMVEVEIIEPESAGGGSPAAGGADVPNMSIPAPAEEQTQDQTATPIRQASTVPTPVSNPQSTEINITNNYSKKAGSSSTTGNDPNFGDGDGGDGGGKGGGHGKGIGSSSGDGFSHTFGNRRLEHPNVTHDCQVQGTIYLDVYVNPNGSITIIETNPKSTPNNCLEAKAYSLVKNSKFASVATDKVVKGTLTIVFDLR